MPYDPDQCTYLQGALRQNVYACLTCYKDDNTMSGICYSCSIQCHSKHELVELFSKREFTCDCGTTRMKANGACQLRSKSASKGGSRRSSFASSSSQRQNEVLPADDVASLSNVYNHNFKGSFCSCSQPYNPLLETGNMIQCHLGDVCGEDWFHDECIMGFKQGFMGSRRKGNAEIKNEKSVNLLDNLPELTVDEEQAVDASDDEADLEPVPGFPKLDDFDFFICWKCVSKYDEAFREVPENMVLPKVYHIEAASLAEREQKLLEGQSTEPDGKVLKKRKTNSSYSLFFKYDIKDMFIHILKDNKDDQQHLIKLLRMFPFLWGDDAIYEPKEDSDINGDDSSSIYDRGSEILNSLPRDKAIESVRAYQDIKTKLAGFLKPFAENGKIVTEEEVRDFFKQIKEDK